MLNHVHIIPQLPNRVVVFGSQGVVGKKLVEHLSNKKINVLELSRKECNLLDKDSVKFLKNTFKPDDQIVFLTAITPDKGRGIKAMMDNLQIIENISNALTEVPVDQFVLFSSESVYQLTSDIISENTLIRPDDLYGCMHLAREIHMRSLNIPLAIIRSTLIYGDGDTHNSYGPNRFVKESKEKNSITLFGNGEEKRSHVYLHDVIRFIEKILCHRSLGEINLCPNPVISFGEIADIIKKISKNNIDIINKQRSSPITHRYFDNSLLYKAFPDFVFTDIKDGLKELLNK
jgi:UDP-glucose 4-epimerase